METKKDKGIALPKKIEIKHDTAPKTHFFYEHEGERAVDPSILVDNGIFLWHEVMRSNEMHDTSPLWELASELLASNPDSSAPSHVENLRFKISMGSLAPDRWDYSKPYPYKGMLTSAIYLQEARRLCSEGNTDRAWHIIAIAFYNLGMNTIPSKASLNARAAAIRHANDSEFTRALVLEGLKRLKDDDSITSIAKAKDAVIKFFEKHKKAKSELEKLDKYAPKGTKQYSALARLRNTLDDWASPKGPYPEMAEAFSRFDKRKIKSGTESQAKKWNTSEQDLTDDSDCRMRVINILSSGYTLTMEISSMDETETP